MEKIAKSQINSRLIIHAEQLELEREAERQALEKKRLREEAEQQRRETWRNEHEAKSREETFTLLAQEPFVSQDDIEADYYSHESDDGISDTSTVSWQFQRDGEVVILTRKSRFDRNGWGSPDRQESSQVWLFASDIAKPLIANVDPDQFFDTHYPIDMNQFQPASWNDIASILEHIDASIERKTMIANLDKVLYEHGIIETGIKEYGATKEVHRLEVAVSSNEIIRLVKTIRRERNSEYTEYFLRFSDINSLSGYTVRIDAKNVIPHVYLDGSNAFEQQYAEIRDNYIDKFNEAVTRVRAKMNPTLFDTEY